MPVSGDDADVDEGRSVPVSGDDANSEGDEGQFVPVSGDDAYVATTQNSEGDER